MSNTGIISEDKKSPSALITPGITASLKPEAPASLRVALSAKQNFALAAEEIFVHALNRTVWTYRDKYQAIELMMAEVRNTAMESVATETGVSRISDIVFGSAPMREFIFTLQVQFFSQFAEFNSNWVEMIGHIAGALTNAPTGPDIDTSLSLVPEDIVIRTYDAASMKSLLLANTWLVMFLLIALWGRTFTYDELRAIRRTTPGG